MLGFAFSSIIGTMGYFMAYGVQLDWASHPNAMRWFQLLSSLCTFLFPALSFGYICSLNIKDYLFIQSPKNGYGVLVIVLLSMILIIPLISITGYLNEQISLPSSLSSVEAWMRQQEASAQQVTQTLLSQTGLFTLLFNIFVIAFLAGITEEFLFRGALGRIVSRWTTNPHMIIWACAIIFSAFHLQFYGFIPRLLLGAYMGYLLFWSRSIWLPVFAHIINNLFAILGMSNQALKDNSYIQGDLKEVDIAIYLTVGTIMTVLFFICCSKIKQMLQQKAPKKEDIPSETLLP